MEDMNMNNVNEVMPAVEEVAKSTGFGKLGIGVAIGAGGAWLVSKIIDAVKNHNANKKNAEPAPAEKDEDDVFDKALEPVDDIE